MRSVATQTFTPLNFSHSLFTENPEQKFEDTPEKFDEIVTKGGNKVFKVDINHFDTLCQKFQDKCDLPIKSLSGADKEDFKLMVSYVRILYGTNYYEHLHRKVVKYFGNLERVKPGTIGGYFGGCLVETNLEHGKGCSAACAGSVPLPKNEEGWSFCDQAVIFADRIENLKNQRLYSFTVLKKADKPCELDPCYVFVEKTDLHDFEGFNKEEKDELKRMGIKNIYLIGCNENGDEYFHLYEGVCNLDDVKHRVYKPPAQDNKMGLILGLVIVFIILVALYFGWKYGVIKAV
jgi:hypothetical protein